MKTKTLILFMFGIFYFTSMNGQVKWDILGNGGTSDANNFIGTTDNKPLNFRVNNGRAGRLDNILLNTFFGFASGTISTTGIYNTSVGSYSLSNITSGGYNVALGGAALYTNNTGSSNTSIGYGSLYFNTEGTSNTATGKDALQKNTSGGFNTANGIQSLQLNTIGSENSAFGSSSMYYNSTGAFNTANGRYSLYNNTSGSYNVASGYKSLFLNNTGSNNTALGYGAGPNTATWSNTTALGNGAIVWNGSNSIQIGDLNVNYCRIGTGAITFVTSDGRFKSNVNEASVKGLEFIKLLRPITYNFETKRLQEFTSKNMSAEIREELNNKDFSASDAIIHSGFIAQEVEKAAQEVGYNFDGLHKPEHENDTYAIGYTQFVVPLVKAVQEQQKMIETLQSELASLTEEVKKNRSNPNATNSANIEISLSNKNIVVLEQNVPNPFAEQTTISYFLPENTQNASINFYDQSGKNIKSVSITEKGNGTLTVFASDLSNGTYSYSLVVDGKIAETKKMVRIK